MSVEMSPEAIVIAQLKAVLAHRTERREAASELRRAASAKKAEIKASETALAQLERAQEDAGVAAAIGEAPVDAVPDAADVENARVALRVASRVSAAFDERLRAADNAVEPAEQAVRVAAQRYFITTAFEPAREAFTKAFEALRIAADDLMAAHNLAYWEYADKSEYRISEGGLFGPVEGALRKLVGPWDVLPYDVQPDWLKYGGYKRPFDSPDVKGAVARLKARLTQDLAE